MAGRGSLAGLLPYGDANAIVIDMAREVLPVVKRDAGARRRLRHRSVPPDGRLPRRGARASASAACRTSRPSASSTGRSAQNLEETGMGYGLEVEMIRRAHELDLLTAPYVFTDDEARRDGRGRRGRARPAHGPDDRRRDRRETAMTLDECVRADPGDARRGEGGQPRHPRPLPRRADRRAGRRRLRARERHEGVVGFFGASCMERLPTEIAMTENMRRFKAIPVGGAA